jgi:hypothetical protein
MFSNVKFVHVCKEGGERVTETDTHIQRFQSSPKILLMCVGDSARKRERESESESERARASKQASGRERESERERGGGGEGAEDAFEDFLVCCNPNSALNT